MTYRELKFSASNYLVSLSGVPDFKLVLWWVIICCFSLSLLLNSDQAHTFIHACILLCVYKCLCVFVCVCTCVCVCPYVHVKACLHMWHVCILSACVFKVQQCMWCLPSLTLSSLCLCLCLCLFICLCLLSVSVHLFLSGIHNHKTEVEHNCY